MWHNGAFDCIISSVGRNNVKVYGVNEQDLTVAVKGLNNKLTVMIDNDVFNQEEATGIKESIHLSISLEEVVDNATFIIEVIPEVLDLKKDMYKKLENLVREDVVIASNTSGFKPTLLAEEMEYPNRFVVTHFWNPAHLIPLVEVVMGEQTNSQR